MWIFGRKALSSRSADHNPFGVIDDQVKAGIESETKALVAKRATSEGRTTADVIRMLLRQYAWGNETYKQRILAAYGIDETHNGDQKKDH